MPILPWLHGDCSRFGLYGSELHVHTTISAHNSGNQTIQMKVIAFLCIVSSVSLYGLTTSQSLPLIVTTWGFGDDATNLGKFLF